MKLFVTRPSGFIGSYLVKELLNQGHTLLCLKRNISDLFRLGEFVKVTRWVDVTGDWKGKFRQFQPDAVFNLAWAPRPNINHYCELIANWYKRYQKEKDYDLCVE